MTVLEAGWNATGQRRGLTAAVISRPSIIVQVEPLS
jgi:hypothetical protein